MPSNRAGTFAALTPVLAAAAVILAPEAARAQSRDVDLDRFDGRWFEIARNRAAALGFDTANPVHTGR